jgi:hypothetical protein
MAQNTAAAQAAAALKQKRSKKIFLRVLLYDFMFLLCDIVADYCVKIRHAGGSIGSQYFS